jgi:glycolate oxidase FAD binding subunit
VSVDPGDWLRERLGEAVAVRGDALSVGGRKVDTWLRPRDGEELAACLRAASEGGHPLRVRGRGTREHLGNVPGPVAALLSTERIAGIAEFDRQDGVLQVAAGTPVAEVAAAARAEGWELPLDPPGETTSVGGAIATAATGPRRQHFGAPRRCILGLEVALASGERTRCGGRVVKNVTGYDMAKLYSGSLGSLGVVESAWLRLRPAPPVTRTLVAVLPGADLEPTFALGLAASRRASVRAAALVSGAPASRLGAPSGADAGWVLVVECAGDEPAVVRDADWLAAEAGAREISTEARLLGRLRDEQGRGSIRARLALLPSLLARAAAPLAASGFGTIVYPGAGLLYALSESEDEEDLAALDRVVGATEADALLEALPEGLRPGRDVFGDPGPLAPLLRAVKQRFDPAGILNPGVTQGGL